MAVNPSQKPEALNNPMQRANDLNDPHFENQQGYFPYDLTHVEVLSPRFGEVTPCMNLITAPGDRIVVQDNSKLIHNSINGNLLSTINEYHDSFFVSMRTLFPTNYEKMIVNPTKGDDLPNTALPQVPFSYFVNQFFDSIHSVTFGDSDGNVVYLTVREAMNLFTDATFPDKGLSVYSVARSWAIGRYLFLATILSRGQLLDYLGVQYDNNGTTFNSSLQRSIDDLFSSFYTLFKDSEMLTMTELYTPIHQNYVSDHNPDGDSRKYLLYDDDGVLNLSLYRSALADIFERGKLPYFGNFADFENSQYYEDFLAMVNNFRSQLIQIFPMSAPTNYIDDVNSSTNPFQHGHLSILPCLAYQQIIAQYYTNNTVDNIFNVDLYMQLLRATMFPIDGNDEGFTREPIFEYNGVATEYDYASCGAFYYSLLSSTINGNVNRQHVVASLLFLLRRSLRYGDYFATSRPRQLAVGQLGINVDNGMVSPIDVTRNLLMQRYLNAANYIGSGFLPYFASIYGVTPSDTASIPRYVAHRKIELQNQITNNTADKQGEQTTNLVGYSDGIAFDVFIDDHGILLSLISFDVLPIYTSGIDSAFKLGDRFDYFNPMLQNIGDQPIYLSEMLGNWFNEVKQFGWTMRNKEYKNKISRAHGVFATNLVNSYLVKYPFFDFITNDSDELKINSDFIRDKPMYLDRVLDSQTGTSPADYYHFLVVCNNVVNCARKIQATPPVLF